MTQPESVARDSRRLWLGYGAMCVGMFMAILDIQVVASSLTDIAAALGRRPLSLPRPVRRSCCVFSSLICSTNPEYLN
jgi:hypothetical protein